MKKVFSIILLFLCSNLWSMDSSSGPQTPQEFVAKFEKAVPNQVLGIGSTASEDDVKKAFRTLALKWHPDKWRDSKANELAAEQAFKIINAAQESALKQKGGLGVISLGGVATLNLSAIEPYTKKTFGELMQQKKSQNLPYIVAVLSLIGPNNYRGIAIVDAFELCKDLHYKNLNDQIPLRMHYNHNNIVDIDYSVIHNNDVISRVSSPQYSYTGSAVRGRIIPNISNNQAITMFVDLVSPYSQIESGFWPRIGEVHKIINELSDNRNLSEPFKNILDEFIYQNQNRPNIFLTERIKKFLIQHLFSRLNYPNQKFSYAYSIIQLVKSLPVKDIENFIANIKNIPITNINSALSLAYELLAMPLNNIEVNLYVLKTLEEPAVVAYIRNLSEDHRKVHFYNELAKLYNGERNGIEKNSNKELYYYQKILDLPNRGYDYEIMLAAGKIYVSGAQGIEKDIAKAFSLFKKINDSNALYEYKIRANYELAKIYFTGGYNVPKNLAESRKRFNKVLKIELQNPEIDQLKESAQQYLNEIKDQLKVEGREKAKATRESKKRKKLDDIALEQGQLIEVGSNKSQRVEEEQNDVYETENAHCDE